jgi:hypothetical protein
MITIAEVLASPLYCFGLGLALGLWVAVNAWIFARARGYVAGVRHCMEQLEPIQIEVAAMAGLHHVSEEMRRMIQANQESAEAGEETRH